jgi:hypothetical protein
VASSSNTRGNDDNKIPSNLVNNSKTVGFFNSELSRTIIQVSCNLMPWHRKFCHFTNRIPPDLLTLRHPVKRSGGACVVT